MNIIFFQNKEVPNENKDFFKKIENFENQCQICRSMAMVEKLKKNIGTALVLI